jgi:hypothetical protein
VLSTPSRPGPRLLVVLGCLLAASCGGRAPPADAPAGAPQRAPAGAPVARNTSDEFHYDDPCSLLEPREVEAVLGAPLATAPYRADNQAPKVDGRSCSYVSADFRGLSLEVEFEGGARSFQMFDLPKQLLGSAPDPNVRQAFRLADGTELRGSWERATLVPMNCCIFAAQKADQLIQIDFTGTDSSLASAAGLVDAAFRRIDKPLALDGGANVEAAKAFWKSRPKPVDACALLPVAEVEALLGHLVAAPVGHGVDGCDYELPPDGLRRIVGLSITWRGGNAKLRSDAHLLRMVGHAMGGRDPGGEPLFDEPAAANGVWERAGRAGNAFVAIRKDVLVSVDLRGLDRGAVERLAAAVLTKI